MMSGSRSIPSKEKYPPVRPTAAWMSSMMNRAPTSSASSWISCSHSRLATLTPPSAWTGSTRKAAGGDPGAGSGAPGEAAGCAPAGGIAQRGRVVGDPGAAARRGLERQTDHVRQRHAGPLAEGLVRGRGEGAEGHAVEAVAEGDDLAPPGGQTGQLQRRFDGVGARGPHELHLVVHPARGEDHLLEPGNEVPLRGGVGVQAVCHAVRPEEVDHRLLHRRVVVAEVQHAGPGEEVDVAGAVLVDLARVGG